MLKSAAIYGVDASGKSNVIKVLGPIPHTTQNSFSEKINKPIETKSSLLDALFRDEPTFYDVFIIVPPTNEEGSLQETRVDYGFAAGKNMAYEE